jgi:hypothetical protein
MESMALYVRIMKYGHIATDPYEIDTWAHGDPKLSTQFHPALSHEDWAKFDGSLAHLLPNDGKKPEDCWDYDAAEYFEDTVLANGVWDPAEPFFDINGNGVRDDGTDGMPEPFTDLNGNGVWDDAEFFIDSNENGVADEFAFLCAGAEDLGNDDFVSGAIHVAAAANKTGFITIDLIQYLNRILKITKDTQVTVATTRTLPALYRDCWSLDDFDPDNHPDDPPEGGPFDDPEYDDECALVEADPVLTPNYPLYPDIQELFVDFSGLTKYKRVFEKVDVILNYSNTTWTLMEKEPLIDWVDFVNGKKHPKSDIDGFVAASNDVVRAIEYVHNYDPPVNLYCAYDPDSEECGTQ